VEKAERGSFQIAPALVLCAEDCNVAGSHKLERLQRRANEADALFLQALLVPPNKFRPTNKLGDVVSAHRPSQGTRSGPANTPRGLGSLLELPTVALSRCCAGQIVLQHG
jgi:hypothetical protein